MSGYRDAKYPLLTQADFPQFLADQFKIHNVEFLPEHFADTEPATIEKVKAGLAKANSRCCNLMGVALPGDIFVERGDHREQIKSAELWSDIAVALDSPSITVPLTGKGQPDPLIAAANLTPVVKVAQRHGLKVLFHNDDIEHESAETLSSVIRQLGRDHVGTCPDFGNFATRSAAFALSQLQTLAPFASNICHAKDGIAEKGKFFSDDFQQSMQVMQQSGFRGLYSLEFEGLGTPVEGVHKLLDLTERFLA